jgi:MFS family permease
VDPRGVVVRIPAAIAACRRRIAVSQEQALRVPPSPRPTQPTGSAPAIPGYAWVILLVVFLASVAAPLNLSKVPPLMPVLMEAFQLDLGQAGLLMSVFAFTGLLLALPAGFILQKLGPKVSGLAALASLALGAALGALAVEPGLLILSRVIEGIGMGLIAVIAPATIALWFPPEKRGTPMGLWATWVPVGSVTMYNLAPLLATSVGWQAVWWLGAGFSVVVLVLFVLLMRQPLQPMDPLDPSAAGGPSLRRALAKRDIWLLALEFGCFNLVFNAIATFFPTFLAEEHSYTLSDAAFTASVSTFVVLLSAPLAGWVSDRIGSRRLVIAVPMLLTAGLILLPFRVTGAPLILTMIVLGLLMGGIPTATFAAAPEIMGSPQLAGMGLAVVAVGQNLGMVVGPALFGALVGLAGWLTASLWLIPFCVLGFAAAWLIRIR